MEISTLIFDQLRSRHFYDESKKAIPSEKRKKISSTGFIAKHLKNGYAQQLILNIPGRSVPMATGGMQKNAETIHFKLFDAIRLLCGREIKET